MTFNEFLKVKKGIDPAEFELDELMENYYDEYTDFLSALKDGCGPE